MKTGNTIKDVAREAGVAPSTVSLAYHQPHRVAQKTLERIIGAAKKLHYEPHVAASVLRSKKPAANALTRHLNIVFVTVEDRPVTNTGNSVYEGPARKRAEELGYGLIRYDLRPSAKLQGLEEKLRARSVSGVIFGSVYDAKPIESVNWEDFSLLRCGGYIAPQGVHAVHHNAFTQTRQAWEALWSLGYRRIGACLLEHKPTLADDLARVGAIGAMNSRYADSQNAIPPLVRHTLSEKEFFDWWHRYKPDAIIDFCFFTYYLLKAKGIEAPRDYGFVRLTRTTTGEIANASAVEECPDEIGIAAVEMIDQLIRHGAQGYPQAAREILVPTEWKPGTTTRVQGEAKSSRQNAAR